MAVCTCPDYVVIHLTTPFSIAYGYYSASKHGYIAILDGLYKLTMKISYYCHGCGPFLYMHPSVACFISSQLESVPSKKYVQRITSYYLKHILRLSSDRARDDVFFEIISGSNHNPDSLTFREPQLFSDFKILLIFV